MSQHSVDNPYTGDVACSVPFTTDAELDAVLARARAAVRALRQLSVAQRVQLVTDALAKMEARKDEIARDITRQMGKPLSQAQGEFTGMVVPTTKTVQYVIDVKRVILRRLKLAIADGVMKADGQVIYTANDVRVGLFEAGEKPAAL